MLKIKQRVGGDLSGFAEKCPLLLKKIYSARGIVKQDELELSLKGLLNFSNLKDIDAAVLLLSQAIEKQQHIIIVGDFDADGATSTALSILALRAMGAKKVSYLVPSRFTNGYGLTVDVVKQAIAQQADLIMTVDNGIAANAAVAFAKEHNLDVLISDHHEPSELLPEAFAIVNPKQKDCSFAAKSLAGVGVAFYIMLALRSKLRASNYFTPNDQVDTSTAPHMPNLAEFLDLVALGTVADLVPLDKTNRILVSQGIERIRIGKCRPGISALVAITKRNVARITSCDLGFALAPRLNAAGRLDNMSLGIDLLLATDYAKAEQIAYQLDSLNKSRKEIEQSMQLTAESICQKIDLSANDLPLGLVLFKEDWHQGVVGIVAARIKEKYQRPVIVFAKGDNEMLKGSCRSIAGFNIRDALEAISIAHPGLIEKFGGHAMAAGLTLKACQLEVFKESFNRYVEQQLTKEMLQGIIFSDGALNINDLTLATAEMLRDAGPWGQEFPQPLFDNEFKILTQRLVGEKHLKLLLEPTAGGVLLDAIAFNVDLNLWPDHSIKQAHIAYKLDVNEFRGQFKLQLLVEHLQAI